MCCGRYNGKTGFPVQSRILKIPRQRYHKCRQAKNQGIAHGLLPPGPFTGIPRAEPEDEDQQ